MMVSNLISIQFRTLGLALVFLTTTGIFNDVHAKNVFTIESDTTFSLGNSGASSYLFTWNNGASSGTNVVDPTLVLVAGKTYTFQRTSSAHPFVITDDTLAVTGTDGSFVRTTTSGAVIDAATLTPIADFTADPAPTTDLIQWTPTQADVGQYYYTCRVTGHRGMTGSIRVIPEPSCIALVFGLAGAWASRRVRKSC